MCILEKLLMLCRYRTASVIFDYYCRDSELSYIRGLGSSLHFLTSELRSLTCLRMALSEHVPPFIV